MRMDFSTAKTSDKHILEYNGCHYRVNNATLLIIRILQKHNYTDSEILGKVKELYPDYSITEQDVKHIRDIIDDSSCNKKASYIRLRIRLLNLEKHTRLLKYLSCTINKHIAVSVISLFIFLIFIESKTIAEINYSEALGTIPQNRFNFIIFTFLSIVSIFIHELGHAAAAYKFNVTPKEIGFGFYLFFPAMFTDVSSAWMASKRQRICIDLAGFYFQIIFMTILMLILVVSNLDKLVLSLTIWNNLFIILYNLNPLFRFDGYWILCDSFGITNLKTKSSKALPDLIFRLSGFISGIKIKLAYPVYIYIYSIISYLFITSVVCLFCISFINNIISFINYVNSTSFSIDKQLIIHILKLCFLCICLYFSLNSIIYKYKTLINDVIQLFKKNRKSFGES